MFTVFAYGSNMCVERLRARVGRATPLATGYVTHRRLAFHKRGRDGSAKADAVYTGRGSDRVWGVVFSLSRDDKPALDSCEFQYDERSAVVFGSGGVLRASIYVARAEAIDASLKPYCWYHRFVIHGAVQHRLPTDYVEHLHTFESVADPDVARIDRNAGLLGAERSDGA